MQKVRPSETIRFWLDRRANQRTKKLHGRPIFNSKSKIHQLPRRNTPTIFKYRNDFIPVVIDAKSVYKDPKDELQQANDMSRSLGSYLHNLPTNGIVEHNLVTGKINDLENFPV